MVVVEDVVLEDDVELEVVEVVEVAATIVRANSVILLRKKLVRVL